MSGTPIIIVRTRTSLKVGHLPSSNKSSAADKALNESGDRLRSTCSYTHIHTLKRQPKDLNSTKLNSHRICSPGFSCLRLRAFAYLPKDRFEEGKFFKNLLDFYILCLKNSI